MKESTESLDNLLEQVREWATGNSAYEEGPDSCIIQALWDGNIPYTPITISKREKSFIIRKRFK